MGPIGTGRSFTTRIDERNGVTRLALWGELDLSTVPFLIEQLTALEQVGGSTIMLDLRELTFIDSSGLHAIVQAYRRSELNRHQLLLVGANPTARRLFELTGTEFLLDGRGTSEVLGRFAREEVQTADLHGVPDHA